MMLSEGLNNDQNEIMHELFYATKSASDLTKQLLTFSKGGLGPTKIQSLIPVINKAVSLSLSGSNSKCVIEFEVRYPTSKINQGQIHQVMNNLLINADQSMPSGGLITLTVKKVTKNYNDREDKFIEISIKDNGDGIALEHRDKIFTPYFSTKEKGSGLGLATAYSIINNHQGHLIFECEIGNGSTFFIHLPAYDDIEYNEKEISSKLIIQKNLRVLLMDDEKQIHHMLHRIFKKLNITMVSTYNGMDAIKTYKDPKQYFDFVIMDLTIPGGIGGREAVGLIKKFDPNAKVIVSSGYSDDPILANYQDYSFDAVLAKPYSIRNLKQVISELFNNNN